MSHRIYVLRGFTASIRGFLQLSDGEHENHYWIEVDEVSPCTFRVVNENITVKNGDDIVDATCLGFSQWDRQVENLEDPEDVLGKYMNISTHLRWKGVDLRPRIMTARSLTRLREALCHVAFCAWCYGDT